jgi:integrase/recombinase XerD
MEENTLKHHQKLLEKWLQDLRYLEGRAPSTLVTYRRFVGKFLESCQHDPILQADVDDFVRSLMEAGTTPGYVNSLAGCINAYLGWYATETETLRLKMKRVKEPKKHRVTFSDAQIRQMLNYRSDLKSVHRLQAIIAFLLETGCRINEAILLRKDGLDFDGLTVKVTGKGSKDRVITMSVELRKALFRWMKDNPNNTELVFPSHNGLKMYSANLRHDLEDLCDRLKIPYDKIDGAFHSFRRGFARNYLRNNPNGVFQLQSVMGHSNLATTQRYVGDIPAEQTAESVQQASILARLKKSAKS